MRQPDAPSFPLTLAQEAAPLDTSLPPGGSVAPPTPTGESQPLPPGATGPHSAPEPQAPGFGSLLLPLALMMGVIMLFSMGSGRKEKKKRAEMLSQLAKGATVQTVGGVKGTVMEVREGADEVVVKVDEKSNTSMRFARSAIIAVTDTD